MPSNAPKRAETGKLLKSREAIGEIAGEKWFSKFENLHKKEAGGCASLWASHRDFDVRQKS